MASNRSITRLLMCRSELSSIAKRCVDAGGLCACDFPHLDFGIVNQTETAAMSMRPLDPLVPIQQQLNVTAGPVVLVNIFTVPEEDIPALMTAWEDDGNWMKRQPGFIS